MPRLPVQRGISSAVVTSIPDTWNAAWFRNFIINFLTNADVRNAISSPDVLVTGNIETPATLQTLSGNPPVFFEDSGGEEAMIVPGPPGASGVSLVGLRTTNANSSTSTLTADTQLALNFSTTGTYSLEIFLSVFETAGTPIGGFKFDIGTGTATITTLRYGVIGFSDGITSPTTTTSVLTVANSSISPTWVLAKGSFTVSAVGTLGLRWAQSGTSSATPTTLQAGSYILATRIA